VTAVSVVLESSSRTVGYAGCNRKSFLMSGSAAATPGDTYTRRRGRVRISLRSQGGQGQRSCFTGVQYVLRGGLTVASVTFFRALIGSLAQKRNADWPVEVEIAEVSKTRWGHRNSADQRRRPSAPSTTSA